MSQTLQPAPTVQPHGLPVTDTHPVQGPAFGRNNRRIRES